MTQFSDEARWEEAYKRAEKLAEHKDAAWLEHALAQTQLEEDSLNRKLMALSARKLAFGIKYGEKAAAENARKLIRADRPRLPSDRFYEPH